MYRVPKIQKIKIITVIIFSLLVSCSTKKQEGEQKEKQTNKTSKDYLKMLEKKQGKATIQEEKKVNGFIKFKIGEESKVLTLYKSDKGKDLLFLFERGCEGPCAGGLNDIKIYDQDLKDVTNTHLDKEAINQHFSEKFDRDFTQGAMSASISVNDEIHLSPDPMLFAPSGKDALDLPQVFLKFDKTKGTFTLVKE